MEERDVQELVKSREKKTGGKVIQHHMKNPFNKGTTKQSITLSIINS
jgi:hypothetical protein